MDAEGRRKILGIGELENPLLGSGGVVWVWVSKRIGGLSSNPPSRPQAKIPCSPFIVRELASTEFRELPEIYNDNALRCLMKAWTQPQSDQYVQFILAIPGSGKSRTVQAAANALKIPHCRVKFLEGGKLDTITDAIQSSKQERTLSFDDWKQKLGVPIQSTLEKQLEDKGISKESLAVLHVDEVQTMMGSAVLTRATWNERQDPFDLVMAALCFKLVKIKEKYPNLHCILTGTNFFAKLVVSPGSAVKPEFVNLSGTFPAEWVMDELIKKYFNIPENLMDSVRHHVEFLSWNRRAIQHFLVELKTTCECKTEGDILSSEELETCKMEAYSNWTNLISWALGNATATSVTVMALILFPEAYNGTIQDTLLKFPEETFPNEVREYCLAGGLNMRVKSETVYIQRPGGCVLAYIASLTSNALHNNNLREVEAFALVSKSVDTEKGHLFERIVAAELSTLSDGKSQMYARFQRLWKGEGDLVPDPLVFGRAFAYKSTILQDQFKDHQVYCVADLPHAVGRRTVDVCFPILNVTNKRCIPMKVLCELKQGYTAAELWTLCWKYFTDMAEAVRTRSDVIVCFMTADSFLNLTPQQPPTKKSKSGQETVKQSEGSGVQESRSLVLEMVNSNPRYMILENAKESTLFPIKAMLEGVDTEHNVEAINDDIAGRCIGSQT